MTMPSFTMDITYERIVEFVIKTTAGILIGALCSVSLL